MWREADQIVHGERGDYPFDEAGKQRIITALKEQPAEVRRWVAAGKLKPAEGELLIEELSDLAQRVGTYRTQESIEATCYKPMVFGPGEPSPEGLEKRVPLLTKVADEQILQPEVMKKLVADCERDIAQLEEHVGLFGPKLAQTLRDARAQVARVKARLAGSGTPAAP